MDLNFFMNIEGVLQSIELRPLVEQGSKSYLLMDLEPFWLHYFHIVDIEPFENAGIGIISSNTY